MARLLFLLNHSTEQPDRAMTALLAARAAKADGHDVALWLQNEGVRLGVEGVAETLREPGPVTAAEALEGLASNGVSFFCSKRCFTLREFESGALRAGAVLTPPERLAALAAEGYTPLAM